MEYMSIDDAAKKWGLSVRSVQILCSNGRVPGAVRLSRVWMIPRDAKKPADGRTREGKKQVDGNMPLPRKTPLLYMSDLYRAPGTADAVAESLAYHHEARILFEAEVAYSRGQIDEVYDWANYLLTKHSGFYAVLSAGMLLALCAIWKGDLAMWRKAKVHISEAKTTTDYGYDSIALAICAVDSMLYDVKNFPEWFKIGCFEPIPKDALPAAKVYYAKYLYAIGSSLASGEIEMEDVSGLGLMKLIPATLEPMISQAKADETIIAEAYLRLTCAVIYHYGNNDKQAIRHIDRALEITLPDKLYGLLAEYCRTIGNLIEMRLRDVDEAAWHEVNRLFKIYVAGWAQLNSQITGRQIISKLSEQNRVVARLAAFKLSDAEIARRTNMSISGVKQAIKIIKEKSGLSRSEFAAIL